MTAADLRWLWHKAWPWLLFVAAQGLIIWLGMKYVL